MHANWIRDPNSVDLRRCSTKPGKIISVVVLLEIWTLLLINYPPQVHFQDHLELIWVMLRQTVSKLCNIFVPIWLMVTSLLILTLFNWKRHIGRKALLSILKIKKLKQRNCWISKSMVSLKQIWIELSTLISLSGVVWWQWKRTTL